MKRLLRTLSGIVVALAFASCSLPVFQGVDPKSDPAGVIRAAGPSAADVQAAVLEAKPGDTVLVPPGNAVWQTPVYLNDGITLEGSGMRRTTIYDPHTNFFDALIVVNASDDGPFRICGFTFSGMRGHFDNNDDAIIINGSTRAFRIDHNEFTNGGSHSVWIDGSVYGVIDHNQFINPSQEVISLQDADTGDDSWDRPLALGSAEAVYVESNDFIFATKGDHAITGVNGARYVFRHNIVDSTAYLNANQVDAHGNCFNDRGTRSFEIYDNTLESQGSYQGMYIRGGSGVIFDNTFSGHYTVPMFFTQYRAWDASSCECSSCADPTLDQIEDTYVWGNRYDGALVDPIIDDRGTVQSVIKINRDYFLSVMPDYAPYAFPHPLTVSGPLAAPMINAGDAD